MASKRIMMASKRLNRMVSAVETKLFRLEISWCRTVYEGTELPNTALHAHSFFELHLCLSAQNSFEFDSKTVTIEKGEYLLLSPGTLHSVHPYEPGYSELVLAFAFQQGSHEQDERLRQHPAIRGRATDFMLSSVPILLEHALEEKFGHREFVHSLLSCFFIDLFALTVASSAHDAVIAYEKENDDRVRIIKKYIEDNLEKKLVAVELAGQINVSVRHLHRIIKNAEGISTAELIKLTRVKRVKKLLMTTRKSLTEIAEETGFSSSFHLSRAFKSIEGVTPGSYRKDTNK